MRLILSVLTFILIYSCKPTANLSTEGANYELHPVQMEVHHLNEIEWKVGKNKEAEVSQSFTFVTELPKVKKEDLDLLIETKGIDSWILRLIVNRNSGSQDLGSLYVPFRPRHRSRSIQNSISSVTMKVSYAAAYASQRFRSFHCPAFDHSKKISSMDIEGKNDEFSLNVTTISPYGERSQLVELTPSAFNGGNSLQGNYFVEIAFYNSKDKTIHSSFKRIPMYISVKSEENVSMKSCAGVREELD